MPSLILWVSPTAGPRPLGAPLLGVSLSWQVLLGAQSPHFIPRCDMEGGHPGSGPLSWSQQLDQGSPGSTSQPHRMPPR